MAHQILTVHSKTPELRKIKMVAQAIKDGAVVLYPTDTSFALGCALSNKDAINKIRAIRKLADSQHMTFLCSSLSNIAEFARVSNAAYKTIKRLIPGPYTFILPASKNTPRYAQSEKRKTAGIRVPENDLSQLLLKELEQPLISITAKIDSEFYQGDPEDIVDYYAKRVDIAVRCDEYNMVGESTIIDMTTDDFSIIRNGAGDYKALEYMNIED
jgi:tRNA threonylcarbamoyl adenosine modification protein (Sua5/YciO/YrdC/YwlC family)